MCSGTLDTTTSLSNLNIHNQHGIPIPDAVDETVAQFEDEHGKVGVSTYGGSNAKLISRWVAADTGAASHQGNTGSLTNGPAATVYSSPDEESPPRIDTAATSNGADCVAPVTAPGVSEEAIPESRRSFLQFQRSSR